MTSRKIRLITLSVGLAVCGVAAALVFRALDNNLSYFYTPTQVVMHQVPPDHTIRLGGLVATGSVERGDSLDVRFRVTDLQQGVTVHYNGILPDLFSEGQGVIAQGRIGSDGIFVADEVLAKHDENYMPPEVAAALKQQGRKEGQP